MALAGLERPRDGTCSLFSTPDRFAFAGSLAALADAVMVLGPQQLRGDVVAHLTGAAALDPHETEGR